MTIYWFWYSDFPPRRHPYSDWSNKLSASTSRGGQEFRGTAELQLYVRPQASEGTPIEGSEGDYFSDLESSPTVDPEDYVPTWERSTGPTWPSPGQGHEIVEDRLTEPTEYFRYQDNVHDGDAGGLWRSPIVTRNLYGEGPGNSPRAAHFHTDQGQRPRRNSISETEIEVTEEDTTGASYTVELLNQPQQRM